MRSLMPYCRLLMLGLLLAVGTATAIEPREPFEDPAKEARYEQLVAELRCLVCQNESIAESNAELAQDLRQRVHEMIAAGKSNREIKEYMTDRYGDFVLYRPPMRENTLLLWFGPALLLGIGAVVLVVTLRRRARQEAAEENELEEDR